jgi:hypothetical protein
MTASEMLPNAAKAENNTGKFCDSAIRGCVARENKVDDKRCIGSNSSDPSLQRRGVVKSDSHSACMRVRADVFDLETTHVFAKIDANEPLQHRP